MASSLPPRAGRSDQAPSSASDGSSALTAAGSWRSLLVLTGLWAFAVTQPILAVLGEEPGFFVVRQAGQPAIVVFAVTLALAPPVAIWVLEALADRVDAGAGRWVHRVALTAIVAIAVAPLFNAAGLEQPLVGTLLAIGTGVAFTAAYVRFETVSLWACFTAVLPVISVGAFLLMSPVGALLQSGGETQVRTESAEPKASVLFLVLDELPTLTLLDDTGGIDAGRFPNVAALAGDGTWYRNHTAAATATVQAIPALLTGGQADAGPPLASIYPDNLFTLLAPTHDLHVSESLTAMCPAMLCRPAAGDPGLSSQVSGLTADTTGVWLDRISFGPARDPEMDDYEERIDDDNVLGELFQSPTRYSDFVDGLVLDGTPTMSYLHLLMPHIPWRLHPDGQTYALGNFPHGDYEHIDEPWIKALQQQRHILQMQYTDALIGQLIDMLVDAGTYDDTLIVLMADHGISFQPGTDTRLWDPATAEEIAYAPLIIKAPGQTTGVVADQNVSTVDILPTVADILDIEVPWETEGAPAGSAEVLARGGEKRIFDHGSWDTKAARYEHTFSLDGSQPSFTTRLVGAAPDPALPLAGLVEPLGVAPWMGLRLEDLVSGESRSATLRTPEPADDPEGLIRGTIVDAPPGARVLVAVDGIVSSASPILTIGDEPNSFLALLPPGALPTDTHQPVIELALVVDPTVDGDPEIVRIEALA